MLTFGTSEPPSVPDHQRLAVRALLLIPVTIIGTAILGMAAMGTQLVEDFVRFGRCSQGFVFLLGIAAIVGAVVGVVCAPVVCVCTANKRPRLSVALVFGPSLAVVVCYVALTPPGPWGPVTTAIPAAISICLCSTGVALFVPRDRSLTDEYACPRCGYDLRYAAAPGCPECGWNRMEDRDSGEGTDPE